jgi:hypothetical protein
MNSSTQIEQQLRDAQRAAGYEIGELGESFVPRSTILNYKLIPTKVLKGHAKVVALRANALMDLYYFSVVILKRSRFSKNPLRAQNLHYVMCLTVMKDGLKEGIEIPRDHFKTEVYSVCFSMWRALPFGAAEEDFFAALGYSDLYIQWLRRAHSQDIRILIVNETIKNAIKIGTRIENHYVNNELFRELFFDILPTEKETWTADSFHQRRTPAGSGQGEGTFDFLGVGGALQSRHYNLCIQDDLVGREARKSVIVMADTIDYHQVLVGATDNEVDNPGRDFDEIVVGNRWSHDDLNSHIRREELYFSWVTHSALGGCCSLHPFGEPIFSEAFTKEKLLRWKRRLGSYHFSCQFLNYPIDPTKAKFNLSDFRYFHFERVTGAACIPKDLPWDKIQEIGHPQQYRIAIRHHVAEGDVEKDVFPRYLDRALIVDPRHGDEDLVSTRGTGMRCRHAIVVVGAQSEPIRRIYLLDQWAKACGTDQLVAQIFKLAIKWKLQKIHVEAVASQKFLLYHLNYFMNENKTEHPELRGIEIIPLKTPQSVDAKFERIDSSIPMVERHEVWLDVDNCADFRDEAEKYGQQKTTIDLLDVFGYVQQVCPFDIVSEDNVRKILAKQKANFLRRLAAVS